MLLRQAVVCSCGRLSILDRHVETEGLFPWRKGCLVPKLPADRGTCTLAEQTFQLNGVLK